jgi:hypothetical protein
MPRLIIDFFRRGLAPLKPETRANDRAIIDLDRKVAEAHDALQRSHSRLDRVILETGEQFAIVAQQLQRRVVDDRS